MIPIEDIYSDVLKPFIKASQSTSRDLATRCYLTAVLMGDDYELRFWVVILKVFFPDNYKSFLPWETFWPTDIYRSYQKCRLWSLERKRTLHKQTQKCAEAFIMLGWDYKLLFMFWMLGDVGYVVEGSLWSHNSQMSFLTCNWYLYRYV